MQRLHEKFARAARNELHEAQAARPCSQKLVQIPNEVFENTCLLKNTEKTIAEVTRIHSQSKTQTQIGWQFIFGILLY